AAMAHRRTAVFSDISPCSHFDGRSAWFIVELLETLSHSFHRRVLFQEVQRPLQSGSDRVNPACATSSERSRRLW
nr:hypothetical protein [Streptomyces sp. DSM 41633]